MFRSLVRLPRLTSQPIVSTRFTSITRFNSTSQPESTQPLQQVTTPSPSSGSFENFDEHAESWISAVRELRERYKTEGVPDYSSSHMKQLAKSKFEPSEEQLAKLESLQDKPIPSKFDPIIKHCTNLIMKDGKKARAQRVIARALYIVRLQLREDPVEVLKTTLDKMGPLMQLKTYKTRVAKNLVVPVPLNERQRNRRAFTWIIEGSQKRRSKDFSVRLAEEIVDAYKGKSSGYEKRLQMHKAAMLHRAYIKLK